MARARLLIVAALLLLAVVAAAASSDSSDSSSPATAGQDAVAQSPLGDYGDGAPADVDDISDDDSDAAPVGAPLPTHATEPEPDATGNSTDHAASGGVARPAASAAAAVVALAWFVI
uniref:Uncharacterized protein n=1 Tax=Ananas comosus var. bracteatus TaxID=296719 RepID=A0A6V7QV08_ANACO